MEQQENYLISAEYQLITGKIYTANKNNEFVECIITKREEKFLKKIKLEECNIN